MSRRVLVAGLFHETHTFIKGRTALGDFTATSAEELRTAEGPSQQAGAMETARASGWEVVPGPYLMATPSGIAVDAALETFWEGVAARLEGVDGIHLDLHGAMVTESFPDVEGEILQRLRHATPVPISVALDLHGNITDAMAIPGAVMTAYQQNPHTDSKAATVRATQLLDRLLKTGERPVIVREQPPLVWPPTGTGTAEEPMRALEALARQIEATRPEILAVSVFGGFSFADIPETGVSFLAATVGDPEAARAELRRLSALAWELREKGFPPRCRLDEALEALANHPEGPVAIVEPADNIGGGAPGDCTAVLHGFVKRRIPNCAICIADPEAVQALWDVPMGAARTLPIGGKSGEIGADTPVTLTVTKVSQSDGIYTLEDRHSHNAMYGQMQRMGSCVVAKAGELTLLLTSLKTMPVDLGMWRSQGIQPEKLFAIGVKAAVAHRQAYHPILKASYTVDTPGPCAENLRRLPYRRIRRPIYPLDAM